MKSKEEYQAEADRLIQLALNQWEKDMPLWRMTMQQAQVNATLAASADPEPAETRIIADVETAGGMVYDMQLAWRWHEDCGEYGWVDVDDPRNCRGHRDLHQVRGVER